MGVRPEHRRTGIAAALLREALRRFSSAGLTAARLRVNENNSAARAAYEALGFVTDREHEVWAKT